MTRLRRFPARSFMTFSLLFCCLFLHAKEGMWIPATLPSREKDMRAEGLEIPVDMLYNKNGTGLNNAVVLFGKGCTGEIISSKGLILTNHHCGYGSAQSLATPDKDYFEDGFWAKNMGEELPVKGLTVTFIRRMENVTDRITKDIRPTLKDNVRDTLIAERIRTVEKEFAKVSGMDATIKPFFKGNQYWVFLTETYKDVRMVGFPPNQIGAFGSDLENWMWPRHTGDFSIFRVYAGKDNKPADYSSSNQPYQADQFFTINIGGYKEGDYTMVYGFPGTTDEYITSYTLKHVVSITDPVSIEARTKRLEVWDKHMKASRPIFLKYTSKRAGVANGWKKWQGEVKGLELNNVAAKKEAYEREFQAWANKDNTLSFADDLLPQMRDAAKNIEPILLQDQYNKEAAMGVELVSQGSSFNRAIGCFRASLSETQLRDTLKKVMADMNGFSKNYDAATDKDIFISLMSLYLSKNANNLPDYYVTEYRAHNQDINKWADDIYSNSMLVSQQKMEQFAANATAADSTKLLNDPAWKLADAINTMRKDKIMPALKEYQANMRYLERLYLQARIAKDKDKTYYPDANLTLRVAYGKVSGLDPDGAAPYSFQTTLKDAIATEDTTVDELKLPAKLKELYRTKDYGRWGVNGTMPLAFTASNHTTGGNSGSPLLNKKGELIGTNFDRAYEGTMSDYYFDPNRCRNISVDIRYTLFIVDKFGDAGWLTDEMKIIK